MLLLLLMMMMRYIMSVKISEQSVDRGRYDAPNIPK